MIGSGEVAHVVIESLASAKGPMRLKDLLDEVPFPKASIAGVLAVLVAIGLVEKNAKGEGAEAADYTLGQRISAYQIIKVVELGVDLGTLSKLLSITDKQKQAAMSLATQAEKLKELDDQLRAKRSAERAKPAEALPRDTIVDTLERLALASEMSMEDYRKAGAGSDEIIKALQEAKEQALKALGEYQEELSKGGARSGF